jgi:hypothetical protein
MKKKFIRPILAVVFALLLVSVVGGPAYATGSDDYSESGSPEYLYYIEGTGAYLLPDPDMDIFYSLGSWYKRSDESWSMSDNFDGPWNGIMAESVPRAMVDLPPDFRTTHHLGMIPYRYVTGSEKPDYDHGYRYYKGRYYDDYERRGYRRVWHPRGGFWFFVAPDFDDWDDGHRRRRRRGRY